MTNNYKLRSVFRMYGGGGKTDQYEIKKTEDVQKGINALIREGLLEGVKPIKVDGAWGDETQKAFEKFSKAFDFDYPNESKDALEYLRGTISFYNEEEPENKSGKKPPTKNSKTKKDFKYRYSKDNMGRKTNYIGSVYYDDLEEWAAPRPFRNKDGERLHPWSPYEYIPKEDLENTGPNVVPRTGGAGKHNFRKDELEYQKMLQEYPEKARSIKNKIAEAKEKIKAIKSQNIDRAIEEDDITHLSSNSEKLSDLDRYVESMEFELSKLKEAANIKDNGQGDGKAFLYGKPTESDFIGSEGPNMPKSFGKIPIRKQKESYTPKGELASIAKGIKYYTNNNNQYLKALDDMEAKLKKGDIEIEEFEDFLKRIRYNNRKNHLSDTERKILQKAKDLTPSWYSSLFSKGGKISKENLKPVFKMYNKYNLK